MRVCSLFRRLLLPEYTVYVCTLINILFSFLHFRKMQFAIIVKKARCQSTHQPTPNEGARLRQRLQEVFLIEYPNLLTDLSAIPFYYPLGIFNCEDAVLSFRNDQLNPNVILFSAIASAPLFIAMITGYSLSDQHFLTLINHK